MFTVRCHAEFSNDVSEMLESFQDSQYSSFPDIQHANNNLNV